MSNPDKKQTPADCESEGAFVDGISVSDGSGRHSKSKEISLPESLVYPPPQTLTFAKSILNATTLDSMEIQERESIVGTWWKEGGQGFIFGPRGLGKTWLSVYLARCIAEGRDCGPWQILKARRVLYVDGEMPLDGLRERSRALREKTEAPLDFLSHDQHFRVTGLGLNLTHPEAQAALLSACEQHSAEVLFLDNLSCLFSGMAENDADAWEAVLPWLLTFRRKGIAVCIIHHSGRNGANMRGTSKREDASHWVMRLDAPSIADDKVGAQFVSRFTKYREGDENEAGPWQWTFETMQGITRVHHVRIENLDAFIKLVNDGMDSCRDIAQEMGVSPGAVSKWAKRASALGRIRIAAKRYLPV